MSSVHDGPSKTLEPGKRPKRTSDERGRSENSFECACNLAKWQVIKVNKDRMPIDVRHVLHLCVGCVP